MGSLWGNECVQDNSATVTVPVFEWVGCFDVINKTMLQSGRGESVQSHVITQAVNVFIRNHTSLCIHGPVFIWYIPLIRIELLLHWYRRKERKYLELEINVVDDSRRDIIVILIHGTHDDVIKWKHFPRNWPFVREIHRSPMNSPHKGQWRRPLTFPLICVGIKGWVNNRKVGDLRRHCTHYDVIVMPKSNPL